MKDLFRIVGIIISIAVMLASCGGSSSTSSSGATVTTFAGTAGSQGSTDDTGTAALFNSPSAITSDGTNLYVADSGNHTIRKIVIAKGTVTTFAGTAGTSGSADGTGTAALFNSPSGITSDGTNLYVADSGNHTIRKIVIATGEVTTLAGTAGTSGAADGTGTAALFNNPLGVASDVNDVYVADYDNHTIRKIVIATGEVTTLAGTAGASGAADGTGTAALFNNPADIAYDGTNLYIADSGNHTIRKILIATLEVTTTLAGTAGSSGSMNGTGTAALFNNPLGIATDRTNLYIADSGNHTIRKMVIATGVVTTPAGKAGTSGSSDGTGTEALFNNPVGVATVGDVLYVGDTGNNTIRKLN